VALLVTALASTGCGSRQPYDRLLADSTRVQNAAPGVDATAGTHGVNVGHANAEAPLAQAPSRPYRSHSPAAPALSSRAAPASPAPADSVPANVAVGSVAACSKQLAPLKIGSIGQYSGVAGAVFGDGPKVLQAWAQWRNAQGGVACHPIQLFVGDDGTDPAVHQALVHEFVEDKGVIAFVFSAAPFTGETAVSYLKARGIPVIGSEGASPWENENPNYFPHVANGQDLYDAIFATAGRLEAPKGNTKTGVIACLEAEFCSKATSIAPELTKKYGLSLVYAGQASVTAPNYTSNCLAAKNAGAQVMVLTLDGASSDRFARSCGSVGFHPAYVTAAAMGTNAQFSYPAMAGVQLMVQALPWVAKANQAMDQFLGTLTKYAPGLQGNATGVNAWAAAQLFAIAAAHVGEQPTSAEIMRGMYTIKNNDLGGLTQKLTYRAGAPNNKQRVCWWAVQYHGSTVTSPNNFKQTCE
jgi:branched-chain amino acid transport system substrate-binding protein